MKNRFTQIAFAILALFVLSPGSATAADPLIGFQNEPWEVMEKYEPCLDSIKTARANARLDKSYVNFIAGRGFIIIPRYWGVEVFSEAGNTQVGKLTAVHGDKTIETAIASLITALIRGSWVATGEGEFTVTRSYRDAVLPALRECRKLGGVAEEAVMHAMKHLPE